MLRWLIVAWLVQPAPAPPALPAAPPVATGEASEHASPFPPSTTPIPAPPPIVVPASSDRVRPWKPPADLVRVPFPLKRRKSETRRTNKPYVPIVDLRDPFVHGANTRPIPAHLRRNLMPDLKDPFIAPRHPRPKGWRVALPGDIRDPFAERNFRPAFDCNGSPIITSDGVIIQRPGASNQSAQPVAPQECKRVIRPMPADLHDPFRPR